MVLKKEIIPAILTSNQKDLKNKLKKLEDLTDWLQIDIMDGTICSKHFPGFSGFKENQIVKKFRDPFHSP